MQKLKQHTFNLHTCFHIFFFFWENLNKLALFLHNSSAVVHYIFIVKILQHKSVCNLNDFSELHCTSYMMCKNTKKINKIDLS